MVMLKPLAASRSVKHLCVDLFLVYVVQYTPGFCFTKGMQSSVQEATSAA